MMGPGKAKTLSIPQSVRDMASLLDLINNPEKYGKYIEEIVAVTNEANASLDKLGKVEDVDKLIISANTKYADATQKLDEAAEKVEQMLSESRSEADAILVKAKNEADRVTEKAKELLHEASAEKMMSTEMRRDAERVTKEAQELANNLREREQRIVEAEAEIARKKELLSKL